MVYNCFVGFFCGKKGPFFRKSIHENQTRRTPVEYFTRKTRTFANCCCRLFMISLLLLVFVEAQVKTQLSGLQCQNYNQTHFRSDRLGPKTCHIISFQNKLKSPKKSGRLQLEWLTHSLTDWWCSRWAFRWRDFTTGSYFPVKLNIVRCMPCRDGCFYPKHTCRQKKRKKKQHWRNRHQIYEAFEE